jgi:hypothetical protein
MQPSAMLLRPFSFSTTTDEVFSGGPAASLPRLLRHRAAWDRRRRRPACLRAAQAAGRRPVVKIHAVQVPGSEADMEAAVRAVNAQIASIGVSSARVDNRHKQRGVPLHRVWRHSAHDSFRLPQPATTRGSRHSPWTSRTTCGSCASSTRLRACLTGSRC